MERIDALTTVRGALGSMGMEPRHAEPPPTAPLDLAAVLGPAAWARLPAAVRRRFAAGHADATYRGALDLQCSRIGRVFAWCSVVLGGPLPALVARDVPTDVLVYGDGRGGMVWERRLHVPGRVRDRVVRSTKEPGAGRETLVERTDGGLAMDLALREEDGALVFESRRYFIALRGLRLPVPAWLAPGTCRVEHRDLGAGRFRFTLTMVHPWWGVTFHQTGVFTDPEEC